jgi:N-acetylglutamate synthase-like GNAT family acetyltransferase
MIRQANKFDKPQMIEMLRMFRNESPIQQYKELENESYINRLLDSIIAGQGVIFIDDDIGFIMGIKIPTIWDDTKIALHELAWFVKKEYRHKTTGYRLFKTYINYAKQLKDEGKIALYTITKMTTSPDINYGKYGFDKIEENWINND